MHRRHTEQWCARSGLNDLHRRQSRFTWGGGGGGVSKSSLCVCCDDSSISDKLWLLWLWIFGRPVLVLLLVLSGSSAAAAHSKGRASGGTAPGSVVMALKCDTMAMTAIDVNRIRCSTPASVMCR